MAIRGILELARPLVNRLVTAGVGSDRIYQTIRQQFGRSLTRDTVRAVSYWERTEEYRNRYYGRVRDIRTPDSAFLLRDRSTQQQERYLWEVKYDRFDPGRNRMTEARLTLTSSINRPEDDILEEAAKLASGYGVTAENFTITEAWTKRPMRWR